MTTPLTSEQKIAIAHRMITRLDSNDKRPYASLKRIAQVVYDGEHWESYFIAVNILKERGVENAKRSPLTNLTQKERIEMRNIAKNFAAMLSEKSGVPVKVVKRPIQVFRGESEPRITIGIHHGRSAIAYIYPTYLELQKFGNLSDLGKILCVTRIVELNFTSSNDRIAARIDVLKANLDSLFEASS